MFVLGSCVESTRIASGPGRRAANGANIFVGESSGVSAVGERKQLPSSPDFTSPWLFNTAASWQAAPCQMIFVNGYNNDYLHGMLWPRELGSTLAQITADAIRMRCLHDDLRRPVNLDFDPIKREKGQSKRPAAEWSMADIVPLTDQSERRLCWPRFERYPDVQVQTGQGDINQVVSQCNALSHHLRHHWMVRMASGFFLLLTRRAPSVPGCRTGSSLRWLELIAPRVRRRHHPVECEPRLGRLQSWRHSLLTLEGITINSVSSST